MPASNSNDDYIYEDTVYIGTPNFATAISDTVPELRVDTIPEPESDTIVPPEKTSETKGITDLEITPDEDSDEQPNEDFVFPYRLNQPNETFELPSSLTEISAIAFTPKDELGCVQDEKGNIYVFDLKKGEIDRKIDFWKDGDYEGLAFVKKSAYVLRMDGNIYQVRKFDTKDQETKKRSTFLNEKNDAEGLCYDERNNRLLVALKGRPGESGQFKGKKAVYAFDLEEKELLEEPVYLIDLKATEKHIKRNIELEGYKRIVKYFNPDKKDQFQPSEIGIHPITGNIYITSSVGKILMVISPDGDLLHLESLERDILKQPEGMAFFKNGDLLISSEGKSGKGKIVKFHYTK
ncbi:MAG: SdiA-regulated domain-containing protein [Bacteroidota bacterium]